jgi:SAM-dependent methyltransferase
MLDQSHAQLAKAAKKPALDQALKLVGDAEDLRTARHYENEATVRFRLRWLSTLGVSYRYSVLHGALYGCAGRLTSQNGGFRPGQTETIGKYDRYTSAGSIEYWPRPEQGITEAFRVLKPGGKATVIGPVHPEWWLSKIFADVWCRQNNVSDFQRFSLPDGRMGSSVRSLRALAGTSSLRGLSIPLGSKPPALLISLSTRSPPSGIQRPIATTVMRHGR